MPVGPRNGVKTLSQPSSSSISAPSSVDEMKASAYVAVLQTYLSQKRVGAEVESERKAGRTLEASRQARRRRSARGRSGRRTRRARRAHSSLRRCCPVAQVCGVRRAARKAKEDEERERTHDRPQHALELDDVRALERRLLVHVHHVDEVVHALAVAQDVAALGGPSELAEKVRWRGAVEARPVRRRGVSSRRRRCSERDEDARRALHAAVCLERRGESELEFDHVDEVALLRARRGEESACADAQGSSLGSRHLVPRLELALDPADLLEVPDARRVGQEEHEEQLALVDGQDLECRPERDDGTQDVVRRTGVGESADGERDDLGRRVVQLLNEELDLPRRRTCRCGEKLGEVLRGVVADVLRARGRESGSVSGPGSSGSAHLVARGEGLGQEDARVTVSAGRARRQRRRAG